MRYYLLFLILLTSSFNSSAQNTLDSLTYQRGIFNSSVYKQGVRQSNSKLKNLYEKDSVFESRRLLNKSKIMLPIGAATSVAGVFLGVDALVGTKKSALINGTEHKYVERPIFQLLGGIAMLASGICIMEFGNDAKIKSVETYNKKRNVNGKVGFTTSGNVGFQMSF